MGELLDIDDLRVARRRRLAAEAAAQADVAEPVPGEWHGWRLGSGITLSVGPYPGRKRIALYLTRETPWLDDDGEHHVGASSIPVAYFRNDAAARAALAAIDELGRSVP